MSVFCILLFVTDFATGRGFLAISIPTCFFGIQHQRLKLFYEMFSNKKTDFFLLIENSTDINFSDERYGKRLQNDVIVKKDFNPL